MANIVDPDETARYEPFSSGSILFAQVLKLVCQAEGVNFVRERLKNY